MDLLPCQKRFIGFDLRLTFWVLTHGKLEPSGGPGHSEIQ